MTFTGVGIHVSVNFQYYYFDGIFENVLLYNKRAWGKDMSFGGVSSI